MANFHLNSQPYLAQLSYNQDTDMILEIGSDQNEGSTEFFNALAGNWQVPFYTVDVVDVGQHKFTHLEHINWQIADSGSYWAKTTLSTLDKQIKEMINQFVNIKWEALVHQTLKWNQGDLQLKMGICLQLTLKARTLMKNLNSGCPSAKSLSKTTLQK